MKIRHAIVFGAVLFGFCLNFGNLDPRRSRASDGKGLFSPPSNPVGRAKISLHPLPLGFEENAGQARGPAKFLARGTDYLLTLTPSLALLELGRPDSGVSGSLEITFERANAASRMTGEETLPGVSHYFIGSDPSRWQTNVPHYAKVHAFDVYPGVDLVYYGNRETLEFDLIVKPGADPSRVVLALDGTRKTEIDDQGDLVMDLGGSEVRLRRPNIYQGSGETRKEVEGRFILLSGNRIGFDVPSYDLTRALVIDPALIYSTFFGSGGYDIGSYIAVDSVGNLYFTASTKSGGFPTVNALQTTYGGGLFDAVVSKFNPSGTVLLFSTYLGGDSRDTISGIAVDADGDIYLAGDTDSGNFPKVNPLQPTFGGSGTVGMGDAFVAKMKSDGSAIIYSSYLGGNKDDVAFGIAVDANKNAYVTGLTESTNFPTVSAFQPTYGGGGSDAFVSKVNADGSALVYSTFLGGSGTETSYGYGVGGIAVTPNGSACIVGFTSSSNFPLSSPYQAAYGGGMWDLFVAKFSPSGASLVFSTYLGGIDDDRPATAGIDADAAGSVYVFGRTKSTNFPVVNAYQATHGGGTDTTVSVFGANGTMIYSTYLGGSGNESAGGIACDSLGDVFVSGVTGSSNFPVANPLQNSQAGSNDDAFVTVFTPDGSQLLFSTYFGGSAGDGAYGIKLDANGNMYVAGGASSPDFPLKNPLYSTPTSFFIAKIEGVISVVPGPHLTSLTPSGTAAGDPGFNLIISGSDFVNGAVVTWGGSDRPTTFVSSSEVDTLIGDDDLKAGKAVMVTVRNPDGGISNALFFNITNPAPTLVSLNPTKMTGGGAAFTLTANGSSFVPNSAIRWNGKSTNTTYVSSTVVTAAIPATDIATGGEVQVLVSNPAPGGGSSSAIVFPVSDYTLTISPMSATVTAGQSATYAIQLTPRFSSFDAPISLSCTGAPTGCTASFSSTRLTPGANPATTTLTLTTKAAQRSGFGVSVGSIDLIPPASAGLLLLLAFWLWSRSRQSVPRRSFYRRLAAGMLACSIVLLVGCSGKKDSNTSTGGSGTPKGTFYLLVKAESGSMSVSTNISLVVQ
jgi:hypothetical protein